MSRDFRDLLSIFNAHGVEYLIVGAHALAAYGHVRATKDLDVWIRPTRGNATLVLEAVAEFGAPLGDLTTDDLVTAGTIFQIGVDPLRIDILTSVDGLTFDEAWKNRATTTLLDQNVTLLARGDLIRNKKASGRLQDLADLERLETEDERGTR
jgi:hypothetical protein